MKVKTIIALLGIVLALTGCTKANISGADDRNNDKETEMSEISGEIGVDGIRKNLNMPIPADLSDFLYFESITEGKGSILLVMFENGNDKVSIGNFAMYSTLEYDNLKKEGMQIEDELFRDYNEGYVLAYSGVNRDIFDPDKDPENYAYLKEYESMLYEILGRVKLEDI